MYQAKDTGRDRLALYSTLDPRQADLRGRHTWVERIQDASRTTGSCCTPSRYSTCTPTRSIATSCCCAWSTPTVR